MKKYFAVLFAVLLLGACSDSEQGSIVEVGAGRDNAGENKAGDDEERSPEEQSEESAETRPPAGEEETTESDSSEESEPEERTTELITYADYEGSNVSKVRDIEPNALAKRIEKLPYDFETEDGGSEDYKQSFDLDGDGNEETIEIGYELNGETEEKVYMIIISDHNGNPKYAEHLYNYVNEGYPQRFLTVVDLNDDGYLDIVTTNDFGATAYMQNGYQALGRVIYSFNSDLGTFTQTPVIGSYYKNSLDSEKLTVSIEEIIRGFSASYSYEDDFHIDNGEPDSDVLESLSIIDESGNFSSYIEDSINGQRKYYYPEYVSKMNDDDTFELIIDDFIYSAKAASIASTTAYNWNQTYGWLEPVGTVLSNTEEDFELGRTLFDTETFNDAFNTDEAVFEDYLGKWQAVIDGKKVDKHIDITESSITETENPGGEDNVEIEAAVENYIYKEDTNQVMVIGKVTAHSKYEDHNDYDNLLTLMKIDDEWLLMDKFGYFYTK
ncbi:hypothetical protein [Salinicoccus halodurans]|uniref:Lipoprotein n=1 Tax=Salinicoccus halodurans TaxID=407035 RepID=A0A0F7HKH6_9STAP|nr:hypothetical protein [Salinicoccus halodurans]AKG73573.1 hypothetical protein AAT16_04700 [Salinicoccus halodurans]SFK52788.1 hypothetical protein SAMN05216235_0176 [Salinicoccus halodurans]